MTPPRGPGSPDVTEIEIDLRMDDPGWTCLAGADRLAEAAVRAAAVETGLSGGGVAILLTDDETLRTLNGTWRGRDAPTNILSFPAGEAGRRESPPFLGDLALARQTLSREAAAAGLTLEAHYCHLVIHGVLHLLGYDHVADDDAQVMEAMEIAALARLGHPDPYTREGA